MTAALLLALLAHAPTFRAATVPVDVPTSSTACTAFTARELHSHHDHAFVCVDRDGGIVGAVLRRNGAIRCPVSGRVVDGCATVTVCGETQTTC